MANPRQRRKARSSSSKGSSNTSKRAQRKKLHRAPAIKGPAAAVIGEQWDRTKTPRQNFAALGLVGDGLALRPSGGVEKGYADILAAEEAKQAAAALQAKGKGKTSSSQETDGADAPQTHSKPLKKGLGRIIRDEAGNVVDIIEGGQDDDDDDNDNGANSSKTPWGKPFQDWDELDDADAPVDTERAMLPGQVGPKTEAGQHIISEFEKRAAQAAPQPTHLSTNETDWLRDLVRAHGDDVEAMARDARRNVWQKTQGQIRRAINKAGGREALLS